MDPSRSSLAAIIWASLAITLGGLATGLLLVSVWSVISVRHIIYKEIKIAGIIKYTINMFIQIIYMI